MLSLQTERRISHRQAIASNFTTALLATESFTTHEHIMENLRYKCFTKATRQESGAPRYSKSWVSARRGWFKVYDDGVACGDWSIPASEVTEAILFETKQWFIPVYVLQLSTDISTYQFGFNPWSRVSRFLPFPVERQQTKLTYSAFSIALRLGVIVVSVFWIWQRFG